MEVRGSWREPTNLYTVVVLPPGSRKSAVFAAMVAPILAAEKALIERTAPAIIEAELSAKVAGKTAEKAALAAANADASGRDTLIAEATAAAMNSEAITVPAKPRLVADDVTSETAASLLAEQGGRLAVLSPEGGIFATIAGRYSGTPNLEVFLKGHAGDLMRVDRRSRPRLPAPARPARTETRRGTAALSELPRTPRRPPARRDRARPRHRPAVRVMALTELTQLTQPHPDRSSVSSVSSVSPTSAPHVAETVVTATRPEPHRDSGLSRHTRAFRIVDPRRSQRAGRSPPAVGPPTPSTEDLDELKSPSQQRSPPRSASPWEAGPRWQATS